MQPAPQDPDLALRALRCEQSNPSHGRPPRMTTGGPVCPLFMFLRQRLAPPIHKKYLCNLYTIAFGSRE